MLIGLQEGNNYMRHQARTSKLAHANEGLRAGLLLSTPSLILVDGFRRAC